MMVRDRAVLLILPWLISLIIAFPLTSYVYPASCPQTKIDEKKAEANKKKQREETKPEESSQFHPHEEILVTATMSPTSVKNTSVSADVLSGDKLKAVEASSALNTLMYEPGVFVMRTGDFGRSDIEIRGLGQRGQRIGVMVDGRPEKMGIFGCVVTQTFPFDNVERLEIIRGPASVFYGSDALGGVVNIITHTPAHGFETEALASYGSFDTREFTLRHGAGLEKFNYYFTYNHSQSDGHIANSAYSANSFTGKLAYDLSNHWILTLSGKYYDGLKHEPTILFPNPPANYWFDYKRGAADLNLSHTTEKADFNFKFYTDFGRHHFSDGWNSRDHVYGSIIKYAYSGWRNNIFTIGADYRYLDGRSYNYPVGQWHRSEGGVFAYDQFTFNERIILTGGMRLNFDSVYGSEFVPSAGVVYLLTPSTSVRALVSKGFRSPQLNELYLFPASNPNLKPEILWNYEIGLNQHFLNRFDLSLTGFLMNGHNFIDTRPNPTPPPMYKMVNIAKYRARGVETTLSGELTSYLRATAAFTYLNPEENTQGKAKQKYDFILLYSRSRIFSALTAEYVTDYFAGNNSTQPLPSFFLLNFKFEYNLSRYFSAFINLENLLNTKYQIYVNLSEAAGPYPMPGRSIYVGLRIKP
jgi:outer membrane receptor protein involved in Fe transport